MEGERRCVACGGGPIEACMGFTLARDVVSLFQGTLAHRPREFCGRCIEVWSLATDSVVGRRVQAVLDRED